MSLEGRVPTSLDGRSRTGVPWRRKEVRERLEEASVTNRMQLITVCLVFLDSCGCDPTPRIHLRVEHPSCVEYGFSAATGQARNGCPKQ
jgi:hypothetical protein